MEKKNLFAATLFAGAAAGVTALGISTLRSNVAKSLYPHSHRTGSPVSLPPDGGALRDAAILAAVDRGDIKPQWTRIRSQANGHTAEFDVLADALMLDGVRISTSARTMQLLADKFSALLMTPRLLDLAFLQAPRQIPPQRLAPSAATAAMMKESSAIDVALRTLAMNGGPEAGAVAPFGKHWVLCRALDGVKPPMAGRSWHAALYGWPVGPQYRTAFLASNKDVALHKGTLPGVEVVQPIATPHDFLYVDYAMTTHMVRRACTVDGKTGDVAVVLRDPVLAALASHEGPLTVLRQPGVPVSPSLFVSGMTRKDESKDPGEVFWKHGIDVFLQFISLPLAGIFGHQIGKRLGTLP